jgi:hypothetical protein
MIQPGSVDLRSDRNEERDSTMKLNNTSKVLALTVPITGLVVQPSDAEVKGFIKFDNIDGEAVGSGFDKQIEVLA